MKLSLFPMTRDLCAVARYSSMLQGYTISHLFVPSFVQMENWDVSQIDGGNFSSMKLSHYNRDRLNECDVIFLDYDENIEDLMLYKEVIADANELNKEIIIARKLEDKMRTSPLSWPTTPPHEENPKADFLHEISVPVIMVLSYGIVSQNNTA